MTDPTVYIGKDLEAMSITVNYQRWIFDGFLPFIGDHVVEVGAGTGSFSELLVQAAPETLALVEPSEMFDKLTQTVGLTGTKTAVDFYRSIFVNAAGEICKKQRPDSLIYVNVLEHIEDDRAELELIYDSLVPGGHVMIFVPALMSLYSEFDRMIGHFRRYSKPELEEKCRGAGFQIVRSRYFDFAGIVPWFIKLKLLRSRYLNADAVKAYDRLVIPLVRRLESAITPLIGKNVLLVARRPD